MKRSITLWIASIMAIVAVICGMYALTATAADAKNACLFGDVTGDKKITAADARKILRFSVKLETPTDVQKGMADLSQNGKIDAADARRALRIAVGLDPKFAHVPGEDQTEVLKAATCSEEGSQIVVSVCTVCGEEISRETKAIPKSDHTPGVAEKVVRKEATCVDEGRYDSVVRCTVCGKEISRKTKSLPLADHILGDPEEENRVAATCSAEGSYDTVIHCTFCGKEISRKTVAIPKIPHTPGNAVEEKRVEPACLKAGSYDSVVRCTVCNEEISRNTQSIPATGHKWSAWEQVKTKTKDTHVRTCTVCKTKETQDCTYADKKYPASEGALTEPTCTQAAEFYQLCSVCNGKKMGSAEALNHASKVRVDAKSKKAGVNADGTVNCLAAGWDYYECPACGKNGDTLPELKVAVPAPGHTPSSKSITMESDVVCTRCNALIHPGFNSMVNVIRQDAYTFSNISKTDSNGTVQSSNIEIPTAAKLLIRLANAGASEEDKINLTEESIVNQLKEEMTNDETVYSNYLLDSPFVTAYYPIPKEDVVSKLKEGDVKSVKETEVNKIDFMSEIPGTIRIQKNNYYLDTDTKDFIARGATTGTISKITVELKDENYNTVKNSTADTALMHATGVDIRKHIEEFNQQENEDGFNLNMKCNDLTSKCTLIYYFLKTEEGGATVYSPIASKYVTTYTIAQHIEVEAGMLISELGIDSGILNTFLAMTGMKQGDKLVFMQGTVDLKINNITTDYYLLAKAD